MDGLLALSPPADTVSGGRRHATATAHNRACELRAVRIRALEALLRRAGDQNSTAPRWIAALRQEIARECDDARAEGCDLDDLIGPTRRNP